MGNKNCPSFWRNAVKARLSLRSAIWYSNMEAAPFGKINWVNPILPDRTDRSRSLFNLQLSAGHHHTSRPMDSRMEAAVELGTANIADHTMEVRQSRLFFLMGLIDRCS